MFDLIEEAIRNTEHEAPRLDPKAPGEKGDPKENDQAEKRRWHELQCRVKSLKTDRLDVSFLIVTLPDPIDSHSIVSFDSELTAILAYLKAVLKR